METIYRKVAVSEDKPTDGKKMYLMEIIGTKNQRLPENKEECRFWLEEIPDNSHQIEELQADKAELLEALENSNLQIEYLHEKFKETGSGNSILSKNKSLIQKMKQ